jgi:hypothetical protein
MYSQMKKAMTAQMIKANALISTSSWRTATRREDLPFLCIL